MFVALAQRYRSSLEKRLPLSPSRRASIATSVPTLLRKRKQSHTVLTGEVIRTCTLLMVWGSAPYSKTLGLIRTYSTLRCGKLGALDPVGMAPHVDGGS